MNRREFLNNLKLFSIVALCSNYKVDLFANNDNFDEEIVDFFGEEYYKKIRYYDVPQPGDIYFSKNENLMVESILKKLSSIQTLFGYAKFNIVGFDEAISYAKQSSKIEAFTKSEVDFIEKIFYADAKQYGFLGKKQIKNLTDEINRDAIIKISYTGHYLYKDDALKTYNKIVKDFKDDLFLTSGIRGVVKQIHLFLSKVQKSKGNLSIASRSIAPPGYSYHGVGDFDVGKKGLGYKNFTDDFAKTDEFDKLIKLGYVKIRYTPDNLEGVRFEPWHVKVV